MGDWPEEQILDEIVSLTADSELAIKIGEDWVMANALYDVSERLGRLYQEVGKKLL